MEDIWLFLKEYATSVVAAITILSVGSVGAVDHVRIKELLEARKEVADLKGLLTAQKDDTYKIRLFQRQLLIALTDKLGIDPAPFEAIDREH